MQPEFLADLYKKSIDHKLVIIEYSHTYQFVNEIYKYFKTKKRAAYVDSYFFFGNRLFIPENWEQICKDYEYLIIDGTFWTKQFIPTQIGIITKTYNTHVIWVLPYKIPLQIKIESQITVIPPLFTYKDFLKLHPHADLKTYSEECSPMLRFLKHTTLREKVWYLEEIGNGFYFKSLFNDGYQIRNTTIYTFILNYLLNMIKNNSYVSWLTFKQYNKRAHNLKCSFNVFNRCLSILTSLCLFRQFEPFGIKTPKQLYIPNDWNVFYVSSDITSSANSTMDAIYTTIFLTHLYHNNYKILFIKDYAFFTKDGKSFISLVGNNNSKSEVIRVFSKSRSTSLHIVQHKIRDKAIRSNNKVTFSTVEQFLSKM